MSREAMKLALEALEAKGDAWIVLERKAITALRERLAQPEQEPVAWRVSYQNDPELGFWFAEGIGGEGCLNEPLYTTPPQRTWVGLTDKEVTKMPAWIYSPDQDGMTAEEGLETFARAIEAKLKEKNT